MCRFPFFLAAIGITFLVALTGNAIATGLGIVVSAVAIRNV